jgi:hypothetical protein
MGFISLFNQFIVSFKSLPIIANSFAVALSVSSKLQICLDALLCVWTLHLPTDFRRLISIVWQFKRRSVAWRAVQTVLLTILHGEWDDGLAHNLETCSVRVFSLLIVVGIVQHFLVYLVHLFFPVSWHFKTCALVFVFDGIHMLNVDLGLARVHHLLGGSGILGLLCWDQVVLSLDIGVYRLVSCDGWVGCIAWLGDLDLHVAVGTVVVGPQSQWFLRYWIVHDHLGLHQVLQCNLLLVACFVFGLRRAGFTCMEAHSNFVLSDCWVRLVQLLYSIETIFWGSSHRR